MAYQRKEIDISEIKRQEAICEELSKILCSD